MEVALDDIGWGGAELALVAGPFALVFRGADQDVVFAHEPTDHFFTDPDPHVAQAPPNPAIHLGVLAGFGGGSDLFAHTGIFIGRSSGLALVVETGTA